MTLKNMMPDKMSILSSQSDRSKATMSCLEVPMTSESVSC
jgi:hypothetical protein